MHDVNILDQLLLEPGAFYVMDRGYIDFERLARLEDAGAFFVTRAKSNLKAQRRYSRPVDRASGLICDQTVVLAGYYSRQGFQKPLRRISSTIRRPASGWCSSPTISLSTPSPSPSSTNADGGGAVLQVDQAALAHQGILRHF